MLFDINNLPIGIIICFVVAFIVAYYFVIREHHYQLQKSIPVLLGGFIMWSGVLLSYIAFPNAIKSAEDKLQHGSVIENAINHGILEFVGVFFFLMTAMAWVYTLGRINVFDYIGQRLLTKKIDDKIISRKQNERQLFTKTTFAAGIMSPICDNLTTGLSLQATLKRAVPNMTTPSLVIFYVLIVVAANATGAILPSGDPTTLIPFLGGKVTIPQLMVMIPAVLITIAIPFFSMRRKLGTDIIEVPEQMLQQEVQVHKWAWYMVASFFGLIGITILLHAKFHIPAGFTMLFLGLGTLGLWMHFITKNECKKLGIKPNLDNLDKYNVFHIGQVYGKGLEYDTLLFFGGIILMVSALGAIGLLGLSYAVTYDKFGNETGNYAMGILSMVVDNIPVMVMIMSMKPKFGVGDWLMAVFSTGTGGSGLAPGSAVGVGMMGDERYTFAAHKKYTPIIIIGYTVGFFVLWATIKLIGW